MDILLVEEFEVAAGGFAKGLLFALVDRLRRRDDIAIGAGFDFDKNQDVAVTADQVDLAARRFVIAGEHLVTVPSYESGRDALAVGADFRGGRELRRGRAFVSAQTFADELGKGREG